jgi:hypothetical protein
MRYTYIVLIILITSIYYFSSNSTNNIQYVILSTGEKYKFNTIIICNHLLFITYTI